MRTPQTIIKRPLLTEKSSRLRESGGLSDPPADPELIEQKVQFEVSKDSNKIEIRDAVQRLFDVTVLSVQTQIVRGKDKRVGRFIGQRSPWKKAIVTLKAGDKVEFFEGV